MLSWMPNITTRYVSIAATTVGHVEKGAWPLLKEARELEI